MTERRGVGTSGGAEFERRGARYPATSGAVPSVSRGAGRGDAGEGRGRGSARSRGAARGRSGGGRGRAADPVLEAPVTVLGIAEHPRVAGRYRVRCRGRVADGASAGASDTDAWSAEASTSHAGRRHSMRGDPAPAGHVEVVLVLTASGIGDLGLRAGRVLDSALWERVRREARVVAAQDVALRSLATGRRSERDLAMRVRRREPDAGVVAEAVARLRALGLVDDVAFAEAEAVARLGRGTVATGQVRRELRRRGVAADVTEEAIAAASADLEVDDAARCRAAAEKRARQLRGLDALAARRRLTAWLMRRGFAPGVVMPTVRAVLASGGAAEAEGDETYDDDDGAAEQGDDVA